MTAASVKAAVRRRAPVVQQVVRMIATKRSLGRAERVELDADGREALFAAALREWDEWVAAARELTEISEAAFAELVVERLRRDPKHGWDQILRGRAN
jgi:hypothetical protein